MATGSIVAYNPITKDFCEKLVDAASGPGKAPYIDGRELSAYMTDKAQFVHGHFTPGTTQMIDSVTGLPVTIAAADTVEVNIGFTPKVFVVFDGAAPGEVYMKMTGMPEDTALLFNGLVAASRIRFDKDTGTDAVPVDNTFVTFDTSFAVGVQVVTYIAIG